jgi:TIR domain
MAERATMKRLDRTRGGQHEFTRASLLARCDDVNTSVRGGAARVLRDENPSKPSPLFFLSYAHAGEIPYANGAQPGPDGYVVEFFNELSSCVVGLIDRRSGVEPGFMDKSMRAGKLWSDELLGALGSCQVFVALLSPSYVNRPWCGMEWGAFSRRTVTELEDAPSNESCIIPVVWNPILNPKSIPACVRAVTPFVPSDLSDPRIARRYLEDGIYGLGYYGQGHGHYGLRDAYREVIWRLAQRIGKLYYSYEVEPCAFKEVDLNDIFQERDSD